MHPSRLVSEWFFAMRVLSRGAARRGNDWVYGRAIWLR